MQELEPEQDTGRVEDGSGLAEDAGLDVHHQVSTRGVLHHETHVSLSKTARREEQSKTAIQNKTEQSKSNPGLLLRSNNRRFARVRQQHKEVICKYEYMQGA